MDLGSSSGHRARGRHGAAAAAAAADAAVIDLSSKLLQQENARARFDDALLPVEKRDGERLGGAGRETCFAAFTESPAGFAACVRKAAKNATKSANGLLIHLVTHGEHLLEPLADESTSVTPRRQIIDLCIRCGERKVLCDDDFCSDCHALSEGVFRGRSRQD
jgi:hypothetical protein